MKYSVSVIDTNKKEKEYEVEITIKSTDKVTKKDKEKVYKIIRIIDSFGQDSIDETTDRDYRFQTDQDKETLDEIIEGVVSDKYILKTKTKSDYSNKSKNMFEKLGLKK